MSEKCFDKSKQSESNRKPWPADCIWPEPLARGEGIDYDDDLVYGSPVDEYIEDLLEIKDYYDSLVEDGRLDEDYALDRDYELYSDSDDDLQDNDDGWDEEEEWFPEKGEEYWYENSFDLEAWEEELTYHMNLLKLYDSRPGKSVMDDPALLIRDTIGYEFINENLLRQAFTRRAFAVEHGLLNRKNKAGCSEELEFLGDTVLSTVVTREILRQYSENDSEHTEAPFQCKFDEGELTRIRTHYTSGEYLSERAVTLGLDRFILYGSNEEHTDGSKEDMMEALIGAVTVDCGWDWSTVEELVDRLLYIQLDSPDEFLKQSYYDLFNAWHQKHFGCMPEYEVDRKLKGGYSCSIRFFVPDNDKGIYTSQRLFEDAETRSKARNLAAMQAISFVRHHGLWINLKDSGITPDPENSINQLQELYQKKYLESPAEYEFEYDDLINNGWRASCLCSGIHATGWGSSKVKAKKAAAYQVLKRLYKSAGIDLESLGTMPF